MSSFKRKSDKGAAAQTFSGTRLSSASPVTVITSTGIPSLDDILGGGLPLSCSQLILASDIHSSYGELVHKYFISQGIASNQKVCVVDSNANDLLKRCMWIAATGATSHKNLDSSVLDNDVASPEEEKIKIAWRYGQMKPFVTTIASPSSQEFCRPFDLTQRMPESVIQTALDSGNLQLINAEPSDHSMAMHTSALLGCLEATLKQFSAFPAAIRVCIPYLGSPSWGELGQHDILHFLCGIRDLLRRYPQACASVGLSPHFSSSAVYGESWIQKLGWICDSVMTLTAFNANPSLTAMFPTHHGMVNILRLSSPHTLLPPSDKYSTLRGMSSESGENNLAFRCTRKRFVFETLHLDLEGGVGERRTTSAASRRGVTADHDGEVKTGSGVAQVQIEMEGSKGEQPAKKKVAFFSDKPEMYDF